MTNRNSYTDGYHAGFIQALTNYREGGPFWQATDTQIYDMAETTYDNIVWVRIEAEAGTGPACPDCGYDVPQPGGSHGIVVVACGVDTDDD